MDDGDEEQRTVWCGNLADMVTEETLYELFLQAAPLEKVRIPKDKDGKQSSYGFITFKHLVSVQYATELLNGVALYDKKINIKPRIQRQNLQQHRDHSPIQHVQPQNSLLNMIPNFNVLMEMGKQMIIGNGMHDNNRDNNSFNQNMCSTSTPYRRWEHNTNYRNDRDRREDYRSNYKRQNHHHRNSDRYMPYRRYDR